jgi:hypothetical protein
MRGLQGKKSELSRNAREKPRWPCHSWSCCTSTQRPCPLYEDYRSYTYGLQPRRQHLFIGARTELNYHIKQCLITTIRLQLLNLAKHSLFQPSRPICHARRRTEALPRDLYPLRTGHLRAPGD